MTGPATCQHCGAGIPGNAPSGLCPKCLLSAGLTPAHDIRNGTEPMAPSALGDWKGKIPGYEVDMAEDGEKGMAWLTEHDFACDLIMTDMRMPNMDGEAFIREVMARHPEIPMVVLTAYKNDQNVIRLYLGK